MTDVEQVEISENHRTRVGRERRQRMRRHLIQSIIAVYSMRRPVGSTGIEDVVRHAGVSRGSFYTYFTSLEEAVAVIALQFAEEMTEGLIAVHEPLSDPSMRSATGLLAFLLRAWMDPDWGAFITHLGLIGGEGELIASKVKGDIRLGLETGDYAVETVDIAADIMIGSMIEAIRRIVAGERDPSYIRGTVCMVLRSFGMSQSKARKSTDRAFDRLLVEGPLKLGWWKSEGLE